jgi:hypothetical protein
MIHNFNNNTEKVGDDLKQTLKKNSSIKKWNLIRSYWKREKG